MRGKLEVLSVSTTLNSLDIFVLSMSNQNLKITFAISFKLSM